MKYRYVAAWAVVGGFTLPKDSPRVELSDEHGERFLLTSEPNPLLARVDQASAVGRLMLKRLIGQGGNEELEVALASEVAEIRAERERKAGSQPLLILEAEGETEIAHNEHNQVESDDFIIAFELVDKAKLRLRHQESAEAMKTAVASESEVPSRFASIAEGTYLIRDDGRVVYSVSFSFNADVSVASPLSPDAPKRMTARYAALSAYDLSSIERLFSQMVDHGTDKLRAFLSGWAALEILIAKAFRTYEQKFLSPLTQGSQASLRERFLSRVKTVMKDKYRLTEKFIVVTAVLFPNATDEETQRDLEQFSKLKDLRDQIFHGQPFNERELPTHELAKLLRKYLVARVSAGSATE